MRFTQSYKSTLGAFVQSIEEAIGRDWFCIPPQSVESAVQSGSKMMSDPALLELRLELRPRHQADICQFRCREGS